MSICTASLNIEVALSGFAGEHGDGRGAAVPLMGPADPVAAIPLMGPASPGTSTPVMCPRRSGT